LKSAVHFKNFVPAAPAPTPIQMGVQGIYYFAQGTVLPTTFFSSSNYSGLSTATAPDFSYCSAAQPNNWFMLK
jgi:hypothetical protein